MRTLLLSALSALSLFAQGGQTSFEISGGMNTPISGATTGAIVTAASATTLQTPSANATLGSNGEFEGASCTQAFNGIFRPECYTATGSGNTLVSQADAAWNAAVAYAAANSVGATVDLGSNIWSICNAQQGWVVPQSSGGSVGINIHGQGSQLGAVLSLTCTINRIALPVWAQSGSPISQGALWSPVPTTPIHTSVIWDNFSVYANLKATLAIDLEGSFFVSSFSHLSGSGATGDGTTSSTEIRIGNSSYLSQSWMFRSTFYDVSGINTGTIGTGATFTATAPGGTLAVTVTAGGTNYGPNTVVYITGSPNASFLPCFASGPLSTTVTAIAPTIVSGAITAVSGAGLFCSPGTTFYAHAYDPGQAIQYGIFLDHATDNDFYSLEPQVGLSAALWSSSNAANNRFYNTHPCCGMATGIVEAGDTSQYFGTEIDSTVAYGFFITGGSKSVITGTSWFWNGNLAGAQGYFMAAASSSPKIIGDVCNGLQSNGGYNQFSTEGGSGTNPAGFTVIAASECSGGTQVTFSPIGGTMPTITGCGTISAQSGGVPAGIFTTTTTGTCAAAFALPTAPHGWSCSVQDVTKHVATNIMLQSATSTTSCTVTGTTAASDVLSYTTTPY